ncbi:MAG: nucleotidyltransferase family protein, partial [bacterium]
MIPFKSKTANLVFKLVSLQKHHTKSKQLSEEEANDAFVFSARNGLAPWIFSQSNKEEYNMIQWPENIKQLLRMQYLQTLIMNQQKWKVFRELFEIAASKNIPVIPLKGTALAFSLYPEEALRPMGDLDILVPELQVLELRNLLLSKGAKLLHMPLSELHEKVHAHISAVTWQNVMIEPHQRLFAMGNAMNLQNIDLFQHTQPLKNYPDIKIFNDRMQAYHLATHAFKGYKMGGMRLGWLLDIALIL